MKTSLTFPQVSGPFQYLLFEKFSVDKEIDDKYGGEQDKEKNDKNIQQREDDPDVLPAVKAADGLIIVQDILGKFSQTYEP